MSPLTDEQREQLFKAATPLLKWLNENFHPHCTVTVTQTTVEFTETIARHVTDQYVRD